MRILTFYYTHKPGGLCKRLYRLLGALAKRGHEAHYFCLDKPPVNLSPKVIFHKIPFPFFKRSGLLFWVLFTIWAPLYMSWATLKLKPDRLFAFSAFYSCMLFPVRLIRRCPLVLFLRSLVFRIDEINQKPLIIRWISNQVDKIGISSATRVICMTKSMLLDVQKFFNLTILDVRILPNDAPQSTQNAEQITEMALGIFERLQEKLSGDNLVALTSGVIDRRKNIDCLLNALALIDAGELKGKILVLVAGDGPLLKNYQESARVRGINCIEWLGWCESLEPLYPFVDLVLHPALHEGVPNSVLEALAAGLPVLCADTPEMREILIAKELLFDAASDSALGTKLTEILKDPAQQLEILAKSSRPVAERLRFDWDQLACQQITE